MAVCHIRPCSPPQDKLFVAVPSFCDGILERDFEGNFLEPRPLKNGEEKLRYLFLLAINTLPYMKKGMETNYRYELEQMLTQYTMHLLEQMCDEEGLYQFVWVVYRLITEGISHLS